MLLEYDSKNKLFRPTIALFGVLSMLLALARTAKNELVGLNLILNLFKYYISPTSALFTKFEIQSSEHVQLYYGIFIANIGHSPL